MAANSLFLLIKSLNPFEKRNFRKQLLQGTTVKKKSNYIYLFDALYSAEEFDESSVKQKLQNIMDDDVFAVVKSKLYEKLLSFLRDGGETFLRKVHTWLEYVELLISRQLYAEALIYCEKVKSEAWKYGHLYLIYEANYRKSSILQYTAKEKASEEIAAVVAETMNLHELGKKMSEISAYYFKIGSLVSKEANVRSESFIQKIESYKADPIFLMDANSKELTYYHSCYLAMAKNYVFKFTGEYEQAYLQEKIVWDRLNADWMFYLKNTPKDVASAVINYMDALSTTDHIEEYRSHMDLAESLLNTDMSGNTYLESMTRLHRLIDLFYSKKRPAPIEISSIVDFYESGTLDTYTDIKRQYEFYICLLFFHQGDYIKTRMYLVVTLNAYRRTEISTYISEYALFLDLLNEFSIELKSSFEGMLCDINGRAKKYRDHIRRIKDNDYRFEIVVSDFFISIESNCTRGELLSKIDKLENDLEETYKIDIPYLHFAKRYFDMKVVLESWRNTISSFRSL